MIRNNADVFNDVAPYIALFYNKTHCISWFTVQTVYIALFYNKPPYIFVFPVRQCDS